MVYAEQVHEAQQLITSDAPTVLTCGYSPSNSSSNAGTGESCSGGSPPVFDDRVSTPSPRPPLAAAAVAPVAAGEQSPFRGAWGAWSRSFRQQKRCRVGTLAALALTLVSYPLICVLRLLRVLAPRMITADFAGLQFVLTACMGSNAVGSQVAAVVALLEQLFSDRPSVESAIMCAAMVSLLICCLLVLGLTC